MGQEAALCSGKKRGAFNKADVTGETQTLRVAVGGTFKVC